MKNLIILTFLIFSNLGFSQILPSKHGVHDKKGMSCGSKNNGSNQTNTLNDIGTNKAELDGSVVISW